MKEKDELEYLSIGPERYSTRISSRFKNRKPYEPVNPLLISSFIPGIITDIPVREGQHVGKDDALIILEAMKMQNMIKSTVEGRIKKIMVKTGEKISKGTLLVELEYDFPQEVD
jgi:biotin carboxyl carrier protein